MRLIYEMELLGYTFMGSLSTHGKFRSSETGDLQLVSRDGEVLSTCAAPHSANPTACVLLSEVVLHCVSDEGHTLGCTYPKFES